MGGEPQKTVLLCRYLMMVGEWRSRACTLQYKITPVIVVQTVDDFAVPAYVRLL